MKRHLARLFRSRHIVPFCTVAGSSLLSLHFQQPRICYLDVPDRSQWTPHPTTATPGNLGKNVKISATGQPLPTGTSDEGGKAWFEHDDDAAWQSFSEKFASIGSSIAKIDWSSIGDKVTDFVVPSWARALPGLVRKLQSELDMAPGSLADEIWNESQDPFINPEIEWEAQVRIGQNLSEEELAFQQARKRHTAKALAKYLGLPEREVNPQDVPVIAICGSGGGLRALVAGTSSYLCAQEAGLFDCVTYTAGVSGSCWLQTLYYSSLGKQSHQKILDHLKRRINVHIAFPPTALRLLTSAPTSKFLLSGLLEKAKSDPEADFGLVDVYGLLLAARLFVPRGELAVDPLDLKLSNQRRFVDDGSHPLPLYTMVRHEISEDHSKDDKAKNESWFSWWEMSPYFVWCEELSAGIPTWSLGRKFQNGVSVRRENGWALPEMRIPQLLGIWGSAFCATLAHYYKEVRPVFKGIAGFGGIDSLVTDYNEDLVKLHPIDPATIPNFALGLEDQLPPSTSKSLFRASHLRLMDAGMSNNLPIYPLLRPGRDVDIIVAFDASADIKQEDWLHVADDYAQQHGVKGWPVGIGWPSEDHIREQLQKDVTATAEAVGRDNGQHTQTSTDENDIGPCTIWIGENHPQRDAPSSAPNLPGRRVHPDSDWDAIAGPDSGLAVVYFPLLPNAKVPGVDPDESDFMSTWNFVYTPEEIDRVVALARANFEEGKEQTKQCVRAIYERKKRLRLEREKMENRESWWKRWKGDADLFR